jgi:hypothetical protein
VWVPSAAQEAARDLVRAREDVRGDLMRARHRVSKLLLRQGIVWSGAVAWRPAHHAWPGAQRFEDVALQAAYDSAYEAVIPAEARRARLGCLRGIDTLTSFALAVEIGDWDRFTGASIGACLGLVPTRRKPPRSISRPAQPLPPNSPSCGNQPAHISMDHASNNDTRATRYRPAPMTTPSARDHMIPDADTPRPLDRSTYISVPRQTTFAR